MLAHICRAALNSLNHHSTNKNRLRRRASATAPGAPIHTLEALENRALCSAASTLPVVSITTLSSHASKSNSPATFEVTRTGSDRRPLTVKYEAVNISTVGAVAGEDYQDLPDSITIPANKTEAVIMVEPMSNDSAQGAKAVDLQLVSTTGTYTANPLKASADASINPDASAILPWVSITASPVLIPTPAIITEGVRPGIMDIGISSNLLPSDVSETVGFTVSGTAPGSRYTLDTSPDGGVTLVPLLPTSGNVYDVPFSSDQTNEAIYINAPNDGIKEPIQTVTLTLQGATGCNILPTAAAATLSIQDMNADPVVDTKKWPIVPVTAPAGSKSKTVLISFPLDISIINKGTTPTGLFNVALYAVNPARPYDPNCQNYLGTIDFVGLQPTDYPTEGLDPGEEETAGLSAFTGSITPGTYDLLVVVNPGVNFMDGAPAGANAFLDPTSFDMVIEPLPTLP